MDGYYGVNHVSSIQRLAFSHFVSYTSLLNLVDASIIGPERISGKQSRSK
jgi:hypothetical protein